ncbi:MAG TPA: UrcA family protein [Steroidobacteraceae bacterium]
MFSGNRHFIGRGTRGFPAAHTLGLIGLLPLAAIAAHGSQPRFEGPALVVNYADLNINTPLGAEKLYERLQHAAAQLCPQVDFEQLQRHAASLRCRDDVVARAVSRINSPQLAAIYASRTHHAAHSPV